MQIEIRNWNKFNPRRELKNPTWFRLNNDFVTDPDLFEFTNDMKMVWISILSEASKKNKSAVKINIRLAAMILNVKNSLFLQTCVILSKLNMMRFKLTEKELNDSTSCADDVQGLIRKCAKNVLYERTNGTNGISETDKSVSTPTKTDGRPPKKIKQTPTEFDFKIADEWIAHGKKISPHINADRNSSAETIRKLREVDKIPDEKIRNIFEFVKDDDFWGDVCISPAGLRIRKKSGERKIDNIIAKMGSNGGSDEMPKWMKDEIEKEKSLPNEEDPLDRLLD